MCRTCAPKARTRHYHQPPTRPTPLRSRPSYLAPPPSLAAGELTLKNNGGGKQGGDTFGKDFSLGFFFLKDKSDDFSLWQPVYPWLLLNTYDDTLYFQIQGYIHISLITLSQMLNPNELSS